MRLYGELTFDPKKHDRMDDELLVCTPCIQDDKAIFDTSLLTICILSGDRESTDIIEDGRDPGRDAVRDCGREVGLELCRERGISFKVLIDLSAAGFHENQCYYEKGSRNS